MGSWPTGTGDRVLPVVAGPKFSIGEPVCLAVGEDGQKVSLTVKEMTQQVCQRRLEYEDTTKRNPLDPESIEKAKCKAQTRFLDQVSSGESSVAQDAVRGLGYLEERLPSEEACLSQEIVQGLHAELLRFRDSDRGPGRLRTYYAYDRRGNDIHWFPPPHVIPSCFGARLKKHNYYISKKVSFADPYTPEYVDFVCRCAASLLYDLVDLHPFRDGNDLVVHLLTSTILQLVAPFPVTLPASSLHELRGAFHDAKCRERNDDKLATLAARLLEGVWQCWEWFASELNLDE